MNFCTLFDSNFLAKGLALYYSIEAQTQDFTLFILCMDTECYEILSKMNLAHASLIKISDLEASDPALPKIKAERQLIEYLWTLSSVLTAYVLTHNPTLPSIAYLDADLYFFSSPLVLEQEVGSGSVGIIPHRLERTGNEETYGKYNVGWVFFRNNEEGRACLTWWRDRCKEWCFAKPEPGKYGDQKYLDFFENLFTGVVVIKNEGADLARWNVEHYTITKKDATVFGNNSPIVFFHFSRFALYPESVLLPYGPMTEDGYTRFGTPKRLLYRPYANALYRAYREIERVSPGFAKGLTSRPNTRENMREWFMNAVIFPLKYILKPIRAFIRRT